MRTLADTLADLERLAADLEGQPAKTDFLAIISRPQPMTVAADPTAEQRAEGKSESELLKAGDSMAALAARRRTFEQLQALGVCGRPVMVYTVDGKRQTKPFYQSMDEARAAWRRGPDGNLWP